MNILTRKHARIFSVPEIGSFLSERSEARGKVAVATLTSGEGLAAEKGQFMTGKRFLG